MMPDAPKYVQVAAVVRALVADGTLRPGQAAPSGAQLARLTGFGELTCRKGLRTLISQGVLSPGGSPTARPRVAVPAGTPMRDAARALSRGLAARRHARGADSARPRRPDGLLGHQHRARRDGPAVAVACVL